MGKELSQNQKIGIAAGSVAVLVMGTVGIYFLLNSGDNSSSTSNKENQLQDETSQNGREHGRNQNSGGGGAGNGGSNSPSPKAPVPDNNAEEKFSKAMKVLEENPKTPAASALVADAAVAFKDAKAAKSKDSPLYHPALEFESLEKYLEESTKPEKTGPAVENLKQVHRLLSEYTLEQNRNKGEQPSERGEESKPVKEKKTLEDMKETFKTEFLDCTNVSSLDNPSLQALLQKARADKDELMNKDTADFFFSNYKLLEIFHETVSTYPGDALMKTWAEKDFVIRSSKVFVDVLKNRTRYPNLDKILASISDRKHFFMMVNKVKLQPALLKNYNSADYKKLDLAFSQDVCDDALSMFLLNLLKELPSNPELESFAIDFCNEEDDEKMEISVKELLKNANLKDSVMDALRLMSRILPYRAVYERITNNS